MADSEVDGVTDSVDVHEEKEKESKSDGEPSKLFVGQVPQQMGESELRKILEPFGTVQEVAVLKDKASGSHKGCAFVTYSSRESAERAIEALHNKTTLHHTKRPLQVKFAGGEQEGGGGAGGDVKLFVGMLSRSTTEGQITELFSVYGPVKEVHLMKDSSSRSKGCAFVRMESRSAAQKAIIGLHDVYQDSGAPRKLIVKYADTKQERTQRQIVKQIQLNPFGVGGLQGLLGGLGQVAAAGLGGGYGAPLAPPALGGGGGGYFSSPSEGYGHGGDSGYGAPSHHYGYTPRQEPHHMGGGGSHHQTRGPNGANLFIYNVPESFSDADLQSMFSNFGGVLSATIFKDKATGVSRGFGFVSYDNPMSAEKAIVALNGFHVGNKRLKVMLKSSVGGEKGSSGRGFAPY